MADTECLLKRVADGDETARALLLERYRRRLRRMVAVRFDVRLAARVDPSDDTDRWVVRTGNVTSVAVSTNRRLLAAGGRQLELWSLATKRVFATFPYSAGARLEFSSDGRVLLGVSSGTPTAGWLVSDTPERQVFDGHAGGVPALAFSPDGLRLASVSKDRVVQIWGVASGRLLHTLTGHQGELEAIAFSSDGSLLATGDFKGAVRVWNAQPGNLLAEAGGGALPGQVWRLQFAPGGEYLAAAGRGGVVAWTVRAAPGSVQLEPLWKCPVLSDRTGIIDVAIRPPGPELVFLTRSGELRTYDLARAEGPRKLPVRARPALRSIQFAPAQASDLRLLRQKERRAHGIGKRSWPATPSARPHQSA